MTFKKFLRYYSRFNTYKENKSDYICKLTYSDLLPFLFAFRHQNYVRYLTQHHVELTNLSLTKPQAFSDLETFGPGASLSGNKFQLFQRAWSLM